ncbi:tetratricopeptide repeat protein [Paenimyroides aestuarii]|uniref:Tetratricopeptide repeat protein n=1 Tax=Paenimyroides aestuarii TaxID=2968490 RepID=A0ABY5NR53_9FLAO|nr:hypothetical protein [Paenimyroides aestuarii]UUV21030.1 hypothetical protein NPX36_11975 [Paenimyroides aestuarii]
MKNKLMIMSMFLLACSSSFAQKNELKELEKLIKKNNTTETTALLATVEKLLPNATEDQKAAYYYFKAQNELNLAKSGVDFNENRSKAIESINQLIKFENETKSKKYTLEIMPIKNALLADLVNEAVENNRNKNYKKSSRLFEQAYHLNTTDTIYLYNAANDAVNAKDFDYAETKLKELIKLDFNGASKTFVATSQVNGKVESFGTDEKARDMAVRNGSHSKPETIVNKSAKASIYNNLAQILLNKENYSEGESYALKAYELDKDNINNLLNVLYVFYNTNRIYKYEEYALKGLERFPENENLLFNLAVIKLKDGETEKAVDFLNRILKLNKNHFEALKTLGNIELQKDAEVTNKINALPNTASSNKKREELMNEKKQVYTNTLAFYKKAQAVNPKDESLNELIKQIQDFLNTNN